MRAARLSAALAALAAMSLAPAASAQTVVPPYDTSYSLTDIGTPPGVPAPFGGLTLRAGTRTRLLIGGSANTAGARLYDVGVVRDGAGHITGFTSTAAAVHADAAFIDGGVAYGPGGVLFFARYPNNELGQIRPGSRTTDKVIALGPLGVAPSPGAVMVVPAGQPGAGSLKISSYSGGQWYDGALTADGNGTYDLVNATALPSSTLSGGPEGIIYVNPGSPQFSKPTLLATEYQAQKIAAHDVDANGDPVPGTRREFITGLANPEGAMVDPVTGDFLFSTFNAGNRVIVVRGFAAAPGGTLTVVKRVVNDSGGTRTAASFTVHVRVRSSGAEAPGSPRPGSTQGTAYSVAAGTYTVSTEPVAGYRATIAGDCTSAGNVTVPSGGIRTCTITSDDVPPQPPPPPPPDDELPPPEVRENVNVLNAEGTVRYRLPGSDEFVTLAEGEQVPLGTTIDAREGRVTLVSAANSSGATQSAEFYDGVFKIGQTGGSKPITTLKLNGGKPQCGAGASSLAHTARRNRRRLWGRGAGRFRTSGRYSSATVSGTTWLTEDNCKGTLTRVSDGKVKVRDFRRDRTITVRAGGRYLAKAR